MEGTAIPTRPSLPAARSAGAGVVLRTGSSAPAEQIEISAESLPSPDHPWVTIVWNDPINLMTYVTHVFMEVFGYAKPKAQKLMMDVHQKGRAVVSSGTRERMELDVNTLHGYGLWATLQQDK